MNCKECGHLFMEHDDYSCTHSACECMQKKGDLMGKPSHLPPLPEGVKYLKSGYSEVYSIGEDELFQTVMKVVNEIGVIRILREDRERRLIEADSYQYVKYRNDAEVRDYQPAGGIVPLGKFALSIQIQKHSTLTMTAAPGDFINSERSRLIFYPHSGGSPDGSSFTRGFFHSHATEFFKRMDASINLVNT